MKLFLKVVVSVVVCLFVFVLHIVSILPKYKDYFVCLVLIFFTFLYRFEEKLA